MLSLHTFGRLEIHGLSRAHADAILRGPKRLALLVYVSVPPRRLHRRDVLAALFWSELDQAAARHALRNALHELRSALGPEVIETRGREEVGLTAGALTTDAETFDDAVAAGQLEEVVRLYAGEFLAGLHVPGASPAFEQWVAGERARYRRTHARGLECLADRAVAAKDYETATEWCRRLVAADPHNSRLTLRLMQTLEAAGDRAGALQQARAHAELMRQDFETAPDVRVTALAEQLRTAPDEPPSRRTDQARRRSPPPHPSETAPIDSGRPSTRPSLIGRTAERARLIASWDDTARSGSQLALIVGEAGIGKTRLAEDVLDRAGSQGIATARTRSYAAEGRLAFAPVADWLRSSDIYPDLRSLDAGRRMEVARLLPELEESSSDLPIIESTATWQRQRLFSALTHAMLGRNRPLVLVIDDLQWCDQDTLEWLHYILRSPTDARLLVVGTIRAEDLTIDHPVRTLEQELSRQQKVTLVELGPLTADETAELAAQVAGAAVASDLAAELFRETEGQPLFVVESVRAGWLGSKVQRTTLARPVGALARAPSLPPAVQAVIRTRLTQLSASARLLAEVAAAIGRDFTIEVLARAARADEDAIATSLDELCQRRILREQAGRYFDFSHDKLREITYAGIGPARRRALHRRAADALAEIHQSRLNAVSGQIAAHYEQGGLPERALPYYHRAAEAALRSHANEEAIRVLSRALELIATLPEDVERDRQELRVRIALCAPLRVSRGWAARELDEMTARARVLCDRIGSAAERMRVLLEMLFFQFVRGTDLRTSLTTAEGALRLAREQHDESLLPPAHSAVGDHLCQHGEFARASLHLEQAIALHKPGHPSTNALLAGWDHVILAHSFRAHALWHLGCPEQAKAMCAQALNLAEELAHPFSRAVAMAYDAMLYQFIGQADEVERRAAATIAFTADHGFPYYHAWGTILHGWAVALRGNAESGMSQLQAGLAAMRITGAGLRRSFYLSLSAEICVERGELQEALALVDEALVLAEATGERWKDAELHRLRGRILERCGKERDAETSFERALAIASQQQARMLELRAAMGLARIRSRGSDIARTRELVGEIYGWFEEGFDLSDLAEAKAFLEGSPRRDVKARRRSMRSDGTGPGHGSRIER